MKRRVLSALIGFSAVAVTPLFAQSDCAVLPSVQLREAATAGTSGFADITSGVPFVGLPFDIQVTGGMPGAGACIAISLTEDPVQYPEFGATIYPGLSAFVLQTFVLDQDGNSPPLLATPEVPDFACGATVIVQGAYADPSAVGGVAVTDALVIRFGGTGSGGPVLNPVNSPTTSLVETVSGIGEVPGNRIVVEGGAVQVETLVGLSRMFSVDVPLNPNQVNELFIREELAAAVFSAASRADIIQDLSSPTLLVEFPVEGDTIFKTSTNVSGTVSDLLSGFDGLTVTVNGQPAVVDAFGTFSALGIPLIEFDPAADATNTIVIEAMDGVGNTTSDTITVEQSSLPPGAIMQLVSGDNQEATVNTSLADSLAVRVSRADGSPFDGKVVTFDVIQGDGGLNGPGNLSVQVIADSAGLAQAFFTVGSDAGSGNHRVLASSESVTGAVTFTASATPDVASAIVPDSGNNQSGPAGTPPDDMIRVWVNDGCNGVAGAPVTFTVTAGNGSLTGDENDDEDSFLVNAQQITVLTDATGHAEISLRLGSIAGLNIVEATFEGNQGPPVVISAFGVASDLAAARFDGLVLDNSQQPVAGATVTLRVGTTAPLMVATDAGGYFAFENLTSSGLSSLRIDGTTATAVGGVPINPLALGFPALEFSPFVIPNAANSLPSPVQLPRLLTVNERVFDTTEDVALTVAGIAGFEISIPRGTTVTHPHGTVASEANPIILSLNQVHAEDLPVPLPDGAGSPFSWILEPAGTSFDPPARVTYPNMTALRPGMVANVIALEPATGRFEITARARVTRDGRSIVTDPGMGIRAPGFAAVTPPFLPTGTVASASATTLDEGTFLLFGGQLQKLGSDGLIGINNIAARPDLFPVEAVRRESGTTLFGRSPAVPVEAGLTTTVDDIVLSPTPPLSVVSIEALPEVPNLSLFNRTTQMVVIAEFTDGSEDEVPLRSQGTTYRTSNPAIARVDEDGLVSAASNGTAFITVRNEGATAVARVAVSFGDPLTAVRGFVVLPDGLTPASEAVVQAQGQSSPTATDGSFSLSGLRTDSPITVTATLRTPDGLLFGKSRALSPVPGGITDAGIIVLRRAKALVASAGNNSVSVVDPTFLNVDSTVPLGSGRGAVLDVAVSPDGSTALVSRFLFNVVILDLETDPPALIGSIDIPTLAEDVDITCTSNGYALIATSSLGGFLLPLVSVDLDTLQVVDTIRVAGGPQGVAVTPDGTLALVNSANANTVEVIAIGADGSLTNTHQSIPFPRPLNVTISPDGTLALVSGPDGVGALRIEDGVVTPAGTVPLGVDTQSIAFTPDGRRAYAFQALDGTVSVLDIDDFGVVTDTGTRIPITTGISYFGVDQIDSTATGDRILVHSEDTIHIINTATNTVSGTITIPGDTEGGGLQRIR